MLFLLSVPLCSIVVPALLSVFFFFLLLFFSVFFFVFFFYMCCDASCPLCFLFYQLCDASILVTFNSCPFLLSVLLVVIKSGIETQGEVSRL